MKDVTIKEVAIVFGVCLVIAIGLGLHKQSPFQSEAPRHIENIAVPVEPSVPVEKDPPKSGALGSSQTIDGKLSEAVSCLEQSSKCNEITEDGTVRLISSIEGVISADESEQLYRMAQISAPLAFAAIDIISRYGNDQQLERFFQIKNMAATAKAHLIDAALGRSESNLPGLAANLLETMIRAGTAAEALAALPKASHFPDAELNEIAEMQATLCRFQSSQVDELGFELIKTKFDFVMKNEPHAKPWQTVCKG